MVKYILPLALLFWFSAACNAPSQRLPTISPRPSATRFLTPTATNTATVTAQPTSTSTATPRPTSLPTPFGGHVQIAFSSNRSGRFQLYLLDVVTGHVRQLTDSSGDNTTPTWSPDGSQIAFVSTRDGNPDIYIMNADGTQQVNRTQYAGLDRDPYWLPDGRIAFVSDRDGPELITLIIGDKLGRIEESSEPTSVGAIDGLCCVAWAGDNWISYSVIVQGLRLVRIVDTKSGIAYEMTGENGELQDQCCFLSSPNGFWALFVSNRTGDDEIYRSNESFTQQLTMKSGGSRHPSWSPDNKHIVFETNRDGNDEIYLMRSDGKEPTNLTNDPSDDREPAWSPRQK